MVCGVRTVCMRAKDSLRVGVCRRHPDGKPAESGHKEYTQLGRVARASGIAMIPAGISAGGVNSSVSVSA
jgi:hypothetical protein